MLVTSNIIDYILEEAEEEEHSGEHASFWLILLNQYFRQLQTLTMLPNENINDEDFL